jgi:hypothetical protein
MMIFPLNLIDTTQEKGIRISETGWEPDSPTIQTEAKGPNFLANQPFPGLCLSDSSYNIRVPRWWTGLNPVFCAAVIVFVRRNEVSQQQSASGATKR